MPLQTPTIRAPRHPRLARAAAIAIACIAAGAATVLITDDKPATEIRTTAEPSQTAVTPYLDSEAKGRTWPVPSNRIASMRALRRHIAQQQASHFDSEANKIASMRALRRDIARRRAQGISHHQDLAANKARSERAH